MKIIAWIIRLCIFTFLLLLAIDNSQPLTLIMPLQIQNITAPTIVILLATFAIGIVFGLFALLPALMSAKSLNRKLKKIVEKTNNNDNSNGNDGNGNNEKQDAENQVAIENKSKQINK